jgi:hypothetical protein
MQAAWRASAPTDSDPPPRAVAHAPKGMPPMLQHIRQGSLHLKVFCTPTRAPAIQGHPCRSSRASLLRRPPLAPPRANTAPDRSGCLPSPRASPLAHVWASPVACSRALPLTLSEFGPQRPRRYGLATAARRSHLRSFHHCQSVSGEVNHTSPPFVAHIRPHLAGGDPAPPPEGAVVRFQGHKCEAWACLKEYLS